MRSFSSFLWAWCLVISCGGVWGATPLVNSSDNWHYRKGTNEPAADWASKADAALDATWETGPGGCGYGDGDDATVLTDMEDNYTTVYIRRSFDVAAGLDTNLVLRLRVDFDDGFVAYLDGVEIQRGNVSGDVGVPVAFDGSAAGNHAASTDGGDIETYDLGLASELFAEGTHVLAFQGLND